MSGTEVRLTIDGPHATLTLDPHGGVNVLASEVLESIRKAVEELAVHPDVRTTVICALGKVFVAGADIKEMAGFTPNQARIYGAMGESVMNSIAALPSITVAAIQGAALGGGLELALACDFRLAVSTAKLGLPEVTLGLIPGWGGIARLSHLVGPSHARRLYLLGEVVTAEEALPWGLVDGLAQTPEELNTCIREFCQSSRRAAPAAVALAKRAARTGQFLAAFADCFDSDDSQEGIAAFVEKRRARWMDE